MCIECNQALVSSVAQARELMTYHDTDSSQQSTDENAAYLSRFLGWLDSLERAVGDGSGSSGKDGTGSIESRETPGECRSFIYGAAEASKTVAMDSQSLPPNSVGVGVGDSSSKHRSAICRTTVAVVPTDRVTLDKTTVAPSGTGPMQSSTEISVLITPTTQVGDAWEGTAPATGGNSDSGCDSDGYSDDDGNVYLHVAGVGGGEEECEVERGGESGVCEHWALMSVLHDAASRFMHSVRASPEAMARLTNLLRRSEIVSTADAIGATAMLERFLARVLQSHRSRCL